MKDEKYIKALLYALKLGNKYSVGFKKDGTYHNFETSGNLIKENKIVILAKRGNTIYLNKRYIHFLPFVHLIFPDCVSKTI